MRLASTAHTSRPWRIHEITRDFRLEDVWALPTPGGPDDLPYLVEQIAQGSGKPPSPVYRALFAIRWQLGRLFGWDKENDGLGGRVQSLRDRLPEDLRDAPRGPEVRSNPFTSVYQLHDEWVAEIANRTVHAVMHIGWVQDGTTGRYRGQMAVLVKPNGPFGFLYMLGIKPFRYVGVYPALLRAMGRQWQATADRRKSGGVSPVA
ncbi:hypothetical protein GCM10009535_21910 [Streptomyces thermocarboxydovorans]|uniref:DUF2867 domain-containing protein n=1 Tax=Streptomyces thermocarboxydovorans TaxID=59298 RepID=A0ABN1HFB5_9ACTN